MNRSIEQSLTSLLPRLTTDLPSDLINLASSLVAQSRNVASNLKQDEEIGRAYVCAHIACERLKSTLNLPPIEPRPPVPPRVYTKLYTYLSSALAARPQRTPKKVQRLEDAQPPPSNSKTPARRKSNPASTTPAGLPLPSRPTPSKERSLAAFRPQNKSRKSELSHGGRGREIAAWIRPVVRGLCAKMEARGATAHVLAGVGSVLTLPTPKPKKGEGKEKEQAHGYFPLPPFSYFPTDSAKSAGSMMSMIACNGWLDVLLYATTRADIVLTPYPPSDDIGLETFAFMGKGHTFGSALPGSWQGPEAPVGWVAVSGVRAETAWRAYMDWIRSRLRETSQLVWMMGKMRHRSAEHSTAETENSWDRTSRKSSQTRR